MKLAWAGLFVSVALTTLLHAETGESSTSSKTTTSTPARFKQDGAPPQAVLKSAVDALPTQSLNPDFAEKSTTPVAEAKETTETDKVLRREQKDWLAVGVMKLSGNYQPDANLSAQEEKELEEKRQSFYSPTLFVDHYARLERASGEASPAPMHDWNQAFNEPVLGRPLDLSMGWTQEREPVAAPAANRENPYLKNLQLDQPSSVVIDSTPQWTAQTPATSTNWQPRAQMDDSPRSRPLLGTETENLLTPSSSLTTPAYAPIPVPDDAKNRRDKDVSEKYFRNLDRF